MHGETAQTAAGQGQHSPGIPPGTWSHAAAEQMPSSKELLRGQCRPGESRLSPSYNALGLTYPDSGGATKLANASVSSAMLDPRNHQALRQRRRNNPSSPALALSRERSSGFHAFLSLNGRRGPHRSWLCPVLACTTLASRRRAPLYILELRFKELVDMPPHHLHRGLYM